MSIKRLEGDFNVISVLSDEPNDVDGLSADDLKTKFDYAGNTIQTFINDSLIPDVETEIVDLVSRTAIGSGNMPALGKTGQVLSKKSDASFDWEFKYVYTVPPGGKTGYVLTKYTDNNYDAGFQPPPIFDWIPLQTYNTAGSYTWTAPNANGNGTAYEIGVFIVGAGGSGGISSANAVSYHAASGGAGGYTKTVRMKVTPGSTYSVVVGSGGASNQITTTTTIVSVAGNAGGSSSFAGYTADGGKGGYGYGNTTNDSVGVPGAYGGQGSDAAVANMNTNSTNPNYKRHLVAPAMGMPGSPHTYATANTVAEIVMYPGGLSIPGMCMNPFTGDLMLAAGGGAGVFNQVWFQTGYTFENGTGGGSGISRISTANGDAIADSATAVGSGGGAAVNRQCTNSIIRSGAGAPGAVYIFYKGIVK